MLEFIMSMAATVGKNIGSANIPIVFQFVWSREYYESLKIFYSNLLFSVQQLLLTLFANFKCCFKLPFKFKYLIFWDIIV